MHGEEEPEPGAIPQDAAGAAREILQFLELPDYAAFRDLPGAIRQGRRLLTILEKYPDIPRDIMVKNRLARFLQQSGRSREAAPLALSSLQTSQRAGLIILNAEAMSVLGRVRRNEGRQKEAFQLLTGAIELFQRNPGDDIGLARAHLGLGLLYWDMSSFDKAMEQYLHALRLARLLRDQFITASAVNNIGLLYMDSGEHRRALDSFAEVIRYFQNMGVTSGLSVGYLNSGITSFRQKNMPQARDFARLALRYALKSNDVATLAAGYNLMGDIHSGENDFPPALNYFYKSLKLRKESHESRGVAYVLNSIGEVRLAAGQYSQAEKVCLEALVIAEPRGFKMEAASALLGLSRAIAAQGRHAEALHFFKRHLTLDTLRKRELNHKRMSEMKLLSDLDVNREAIRLLQGKRAIDELQLEKNALIADSALIAGFLILSALIAIYFLYRGQRRLNLSLAQEIEDHKSGHRRLRESEEVFRALAESSRVGIITIRNRRFFYANPAFCLMSGYTWHELEKIPPETLIHHDDYSRLLRETQELRSVTPGDPVSPIKFRGWRHDGEIRIIEFYGAFFQWEQQSAFVATLLDVTGDEQRRQELLETRKNESIGLLAGGIAHDFNNSLAVIIGYLYMCLEISPEIPSAQKKLHTALNAAQTIADKVIAFLENTGFPQF